MEPGAYRATYREYVGVIYELAEEGIPVIQARIASWLGVSRPSVSEMMRRMSDEGLVDIGEQISLTADGRRLAEVVVRRHRLAERFLTEVLGMPWVKVHAEAEVWELVISDDVEKAMWDKLVDPRTCPHGNPIPGAGYRPPEVVALSGLAAGEPRVLERISEELELDASVMDFLDSHNLRPGALVSLAGHGPDGTLTVKVGEHDGVGVGKYVADRVFVAV